MDDKPVFKKWESDISTFFHGLPKWAQLVVSLILAAVVLGLAFWVGNGAYYQVFPLSSEVGSSVVTSGGCPTGQEQFCLPFDNAFASATLDGTKCQIQVVPRDGTQKTVKATLCAALAADGSAAIRMPLVANHEPNAVNVYGSDSYPLSAVDLYSGIGAMAVNGRDMLVQFHLYLDTDHKYKLRLDEADFLDTITQITKITAATVNPGTEPSEVAEVDGTDAAGTAYHNYYALAGYGGIGSPKNFTDPVVKNTNGTYSTLVTNPSVNDPAKVTFLIPYASFVSETSPDRDYGLEQGLSLSPIYHPAGCGLEDSLSDAAFNVSTSNSDDVIAINFGYAPLLHLSNSTQGYDPVQYGKIVGSMSMTTFLANVASPKAINSTATVEMLSIDGYTVKHTGPITLDRTCQSRYPITYDVYQGVKNGAVVTLTVNNDPENAPVSASSSEALIGQVLSTLTLSRQ